MLREHAPTRPDWPSLRRPDCQTRAISCSAWQCKTCTEKNQPTLRNIGFASRWDLVKLLLRHVQHLADSLSDAAHFLPVANFDKERYSKGSSRLSVKMGHGHKVLVRVDLQLVLRYLFHSQLNKINNGYKFEKNEAKVTIRIFDKTFTIAELLYRPWMSL